MKSIKTIIILIGTSAIILSAYLLLSRNQSENNSGKNQPQTSTFENEDIPGKAKLNRSYHSQINARPGRKGSPLPPTTSPEKLNQDIDANDLAKYVGESTAKALAEEGPYKPQHVRTIAHSLNSLEKQLDELRREGAPAEQLHAIATPYYQLQNHYYAILNKLEPHEPNKESIKRLADLEERLRLESSHLSEKEREELKRKILLYPMDEAPNQAD